MNGIANTCLKIYFVEISRNKLFQEFIRGKIKEASPCLKYQFVDNLKQRALQNFIFLNIKFFFS